ncbi:hypothetical protein [Radiobacillus deserti]|nr:hypothetical protein [Radiobacillus deserti]
MAKKEKECPLKIKKETFGTIPIEEAFRQAFEPYFNPDNKKIHST